MLPMFSISPRIGPSVSAEISSDPVLRICNVLEQIDRRMHTPDDSDHPPRHSTREMGTVPDIDHHAPRSASRYRRTRIKSVSSPPNMTSRAVRLPKILLGALDPGIASLGFRER